YNYNRDDYRFENSPVSEEWRRFQQEQQTIAREMDRLGDQRGSAAVRSTVDSLRKAGVNRNFHFADTTTNPALFLLAYNQVDFDKDYNRLKQFIQRAGRRFPLNTAVQTLVRNTLDYVSTFSSPLQIGDMLPSLQLFDSSGRRRIVGPVKDKYLLVDCWSSWCETCRIFSAAKKTAWQHADTSRFAIVSIAVDAERQAWINILRFEHYPWEQVIDEKMWMGPAARAFHFDSLPYNFFVAPGGRILSKSIPGDSLIPVLAAHGLLRKHT
ncbi:MAG TPA: thioredoxin-like domain-containing protein, partial [Puia sp.]|nr:thioredoxin-like domain-containing protein [Puia sp.]